MEKIVIGKPYLVDEDDVARLEAVIKGPGFEKVHYFEVQKEYGKYLCYERSDAFVASLLYFAMVNGFDIQCEAPMSAKFYYQLTRILIPTMCRYHNDIFSAITLNTEVESTPVENQHAVGTAVSGGVDSFYTIVTNLNTEIKEYNITHLLVANSFNFFQGDADTRRRFNEIAENSQKIADDLKLPLIKIYSNHSEFWFKNYQNIFAMKYASYPLALQKLFSVYYFSSGYEYSDFSVTTTDLDSSHYDAISVPQASNENFSFILIGGEATRSHKLKTIMENKVVQNRLQVCNLKTENCSCCEKCMRTQMTLYGYGKLNAFNKSFDLKKFDEYKNKTLIRMITVQAPFDKDNLNIIRNNGIKIPRKVVIIGKAKRPIYLFKQFVKKNNFIRTIYFRIKKADYNDELVKIQRYNTDKEFAKKCDSGII